MPGELETALYLLSDQLLVLSDDVVVLLQGLLHLLFLLLLLTGFMNCLGDHTCGGVTGRSDLHSAVKHTESCWQTDPPAP